MEPRGPHDAGRALAANPVPHPTGLPVVFYAPHADDETLWMGQAIAHHAIVGREVHVVLCSTGIGSAALGAINGVTGNSWWGWHHDPAREGYTPLSEAEFGNARDREFLAACGQLGVQAANVHFASTRGNDIEPGWVASVIADMATKYPTAGHYTTWWGDDHPDHAAVGTALKELRLVDPVLYRDSRWMVKPAQASTAGARVYGLPAESAAEIKRMSIRAAWCYRAWAPPHAYAIGYHSVANMFSAVEQGAPNWIVRP